MMLSDRPNVILFMADDMGFSDIGCYGGEISTPNIDGVAARGLRFSQFYNNAVCMPTRASLLTGLYAHRVGAAEHARLNKAGNVTLAEVLKAAGYRTLMTGKWHNGSRPGELPTDRGFDRYWGLLSGSSNYFNPGTRRSGELEPAHKSPGDMRPWGIDDQIIHPFTPDSPDFYATDAFTEQAISFLDHYASEDRPFFLYVAYTAPHFPIQAPDEEIECYLGTYMIGWDEVRRRRMARLVEMGLIASHWRLSPRDSLSPAWEDVDDQRSWDRKMAVYAAMITRMDKGIGRILDKVRDLGKDENTLVMFLSDNGGCAEHIDRTPNVPPGGVDSYCTVDAPWANASNTPFRRFKVFDHEGGISTPFVVAWPGVIRQGGGICHDIAHVVDIMPTLLEAARAEYPSEWNGHPVHPMDGRSLLPALCGEALGERGPLFWEFRGCRAARLDNWKIVSQGPPRRHVGVEIEPGHEGWELYDMEADRTETNDLAAANPGKVAELARLWEGWHADCEDAARRPAR